MTIDQLIAFTTVVDEGGLRAASKVLNKTQPTLSISIKNLEEELGLTLLDRQSYRVKATLSGELMFLKAKEILEKVNDFSNSAKEQAMGKEPIIKVTIDYLCPMSSTLKIIQEFSMSCGDTKIDMDFEILSGAENKILAHQSNIAITPFIKNHSKIISEKLIDIEILPVISNRLLKNQKNKMSSINKIPQIIVQNTDHEKSNVSFAADSESPKYFVTDHHIKRELIINGFGWGHLEKSSIINELKLKSLSEIKVKGFKCHKIPLYLIRSKDAACGPVTSKLWEFIVKNF